MLRGTSQQGAHWHDVKLKGKEIIKTGLQTRTEEARDMRGHLEISQWGMMSQKEAGRVFLKGQDVIREVKQCEY